MSQVRIGVVGAGLIGKKHVEVLLSGHADYMLAGVADPSAEARDEVGEEPRPSSVIRDAGEEHIL